MLNALVGLTRPLNCLITACSVGVGALTAGVAVDSFTLVVAGLSAALIAAFGNCHNDLKDLEIDRVNRPWRPLPSGRVSRRCAAVECSLLGVMGLSLAWWLGHWTGIIASSVVVGLFLYNVSLKSSLIWGNITVSGIAAAAFPYGAIASGNWGRSWIPAAFALLFHISREIIKDVEDLEGDRRQGVRTLAMAIGLRGATLVAIAVYGVLVAVTLLPVFLDLYGGAYLMAIVVLDILLLGVLLRFWRRLPQCVGQGTSRLLTAGMALGLLAITAGEFYLNGRSAIP